MPYEILADRTGASENSGALSRSEPLLHIRLTPHQSLSREGFVTFIGITFVLMMVPLTVFIGSGLWWGVAAHVFGALALCWTLLRRSWKDGTLTEDLRLWSDRIEIARYNPRSADQHWEANPYWVQLKLHPKPVTNYLTLSGGSRDVELGRFLTPEERLSLRDLLERRLSGGAP